MVIVAAAVAAAGCRFACLLSDNNNKISSVAKSTIHCAYVAGFTSPPPTTPPPSCVSMSLWIWVSISRSVCLPVRAAILMPLLMPHIKY